MCNKKTTHGLKAMHIAQSTLIFVSLITIAVGAFLFIQTYTKRSIQGNLQAAGDQIGDQYALGLTNGLDHNSSRSFYFELRTAGLNNPTRLTVTSGSVESNILRRMRPIHQSWP